MSDTAVAVKGNEHDEALKDRVGRLMQFLRELVASRSTPVLDVARHAEHYWLADALEVAQIAPLAGPGEVLLRTPRVLLDSPPDVPRPLRGWVSILDVDNSALSAPPLSPRGPDPDGGDVTLLLDEAAGLQDVYDDWLPSWQEWAVVDRERRPRHRLHESLVRMRQSVTDQPESMEVVLAAGLLTLPGTRGERVHTHLVTQAVTLTQDQETGDLLCVVGEDSAPRLEDSQLLTGHEAFDPSGTSHLRGRLGELVQTPLDPELLTFLKEWADRACTVSVEVTDDGVGHGDAHLSPGPALVLRRRGAFALLEYYDQMIAASRRSDEPVPLGIAQLVSAIEPDERLAWLERTGASAAIDLAADPLFPLPANEEQRQIIQRLGADSGVVVEGPPGTGKTHTIANLVSTLLASGQRILVTSEKAQALRVLRDKLPPELQELCVSITDVARGGSTELNRSVASLAERKAAFNPQAQDREIADLAQRRTQVRRDRARTLEDIRALRESETYQHPDIAPGYRGTRAAITQTVLASASRHDWLEGEVRGPIPLTAAELDELLQLVATETDERRARSTQTLTSHERRPDLAVVTDLVVRVGRGDAAEAAADSRLQPLLDQGADLPGLVRFLEDAGAQLRALRAGAPWGVALADRVLAGRDDYLWQRVSAVAPAVSAARAADGHLGTSRVDGLSDVGPAAHRAFTDLAEYLSGGGALKRLFKSEQQKAVQDWLPEVRVDAQPISTAADAQRVRAHLDVYALARDVADLLGPLDVAVDTTGHRPAVVGRLVETVTTVEAVRAAVGVVADLRERLARIGVPVTTVADAERVVEDGARLLASHDGRLARAELERLADAAVVAGSPAPECHALVAALRAMDETAVSTALDRLARGDHQKQEQARTASLLARLGGASAQVRDLVVATAGAPGWSERITAWPESWAWATARTWLVDQSEPGRDDVLADRLTQLDAELGTLTARLGAAKAWRATLARMNASQVQALQSYRDALSNVGMGTGKYAERFRQAARSAMQTAQGAVPAWVMPLQQVLASIPPEQNTFDVVIVDEASQADISSLFLMWLAPRVIVVGDDKQCTPSEVSAGALDRVFERLDSYLYDVPTYLRDTLTPRSSIFSMLRTRFGQVVRLREHFRCMPEIITWSSQTFYRDAPLVPVRQFGGDRLPPLRTTYVPGAPSEGSSARLHNVTEAEAIIEAIEQCLRDPAYDDKTFGVVVLQGHAQVDVIRNALWQRIPSEVRDERRLRVGTPPDFQGDERHVVMLSMVVGSERPPMAMTKLEYQRRFNVAASRAQDQLWLFHSVTADLLRSTDLRHSLLTYCQAARGGEVSAMPTGVTRDAKHRDFDSLFEQRVFLDLVDRGYHVTPQVEVNNRRIDLVVTGRGSKLAVECDGDAWHSSPEQVQADLDREVELRRCGWTFWRVRESEYYLDRERALSTLWTTLDNRGIGPYQASVGNSPSADAPSGPDQAVTWTPPQLPTDDDSPVDDDQNVARSPASSPEPPAVPIRRLATTVDVPARREAPPSTQPERGFHRLQRSGSADARAAALRLALNGPLNNVELREKLSLTSEDARAVLQQLVAEGLLRRTGATKGTRYHLVRPGEQEPSDGA